MSTQKFEDETQQQKYQDKCLASKLFDELLKPTPAETYTEYNEKLREEELQRQRDFIAWAESLQPRKLLDRKRKFQDKTIRSDKNTTFYLVINTRYFHLVINTLMRYKNLLQIEAENLRERTSVKVVFREKRTLNLDQLIDRMQLNGTDVKLDFLAAIAYYNALDCIGTTVFNCLHHVPRGPKRSDHGINN